MSSKSTCYFTTCCFCIKTKTGCFIMGYCGVVGLFFSLLSVIAGMVVVTIAREKNVKVNHIAPVVMALSGVFIFLIALALIFTILLLVGMHKNKPGFVKAYLVYSYIFIVIFAIVTVASLILGHGGYPDVLGKFIELLLCIYYTLVVRNQYIDMKEENGEFSDQEVQKV